MSVLTGLRSPESICPVVARDCWLDPPLQVALANIEKIRLTTTFFSSLLEENRLHAGMITQNSARPPEVARSGLARHSFGDNPATYAKTMGKSCTVTLLLFAFVASACSTGQQNSTEPATLDDQDDQACRISGVSQGSQAYSECRKQLGAGRPASKGQTQESRQRNIDARMQMGIPPASGR
jgi:hypothetical protein